MTLGTIDLGEQLRVHKRVKDSPNGNKTIWDAFETLDSNHSSEVERVEEEIILPDGLTASFNDLTAIAAMLGSLLSPEACINVGLFADGLATCVEVDANDLCHSHNVKAYLAEQRLSKELPRRDVTARVDIEVTDGTINPPITSLVWFLAQNGRFLLSVRQDRIDLSARMQLRKLIAFACARVLDPRAIPTYDAMPTRRHDKCHQSKPLVELVFKHKQLRPTALAIIDNTSSQTLTYAELWHASSVILQQISEQVNLSRKHPRIALFMERSWQHLASIIAIQRMGGTCVLIDPVHPDYRINSYIEECDPDAILAAASTTARADNLSGYTVINIGKKYLQLSQLDRKYADWVKTTEQDCFIAETSGSTGRPKAARLSYTGMVATIGTIIDYAALNERSRGSWLSSPGYGMVEVDPLPVLGAGGTVCIPSSEVVKDARLLAQWFKKHNVTHTLVMTSIAETLWANGQQLALNTMLIAGERCKQWPPTSLNYRVLNVYGSAEAAVVSIEDLSATRRTLLPSTGRAVPGVNLYIVDEHGQELPANCIGELIITGSTLSIGYLNDQDTVKNFHSNKLDSSSALQYTSGDRARMRLDGTLDIFGRSDAVVKIRGNRVDLAEVDITALEVEGVIKAATTSITDDTGTTLVLFVEQAPGAACVVEAVRQHLGDRLQPAAQPSQIVSGILPLGSNGKVDYSALRSVKIKRDANQLVFYPSTKVETAVRDCWLTWTRSDEAILTSSFFQSGGDSLRAMRLVGELACKHGINIEMSAFIGNPVLSNLVQLANASKEAHLPQFDNLAVNEQGLPFELNESQQALWIGRGADFDYGGVGCQGYFEWEVKQLNHKNFVRAVGLLVARHPMLRMTIDDTGKQRIGAVDGTQAVKFVDLSELPQSKINEEIDLIRSQMADEEIGTSQWPLFQFKVSKISSDLSRIHFCVDMLIADAWSIFQVIIPDLIELYKDDKAQLPELKTTFSDYVAYRHKVVKSERYRADKDYWLQKITQLPAAPKLPLLEKGESSLIQKFQRHHSTLEKDSWDQLKAQAQKRNISPSGVVALALCEVLRCWSEERQFTLNFPVSDRMPVSDDIDLVVGDFTNTLLVPYEPVANETFEVRGQRLQNSIWQALDHRLFTGVEVLRELSRFRQSGLTPLMPVVLTSLLGHPGRHDVSLLGREVFGVSQTPQVTLDVQIRESQGTLYFKWDYLSGVIRPDVIEAMFEAFCEFLQELSKDPQEWDRTEREFRPQAQIAVRNSVNMTEAAVPQIHLRDMLLARVKDPGNTLALIDANHSYTWAELGNASAHISQLMKGVSKPNDQFVGIILPKGVLHYASVYACLLAGLGYVPIDIDLPPERMRKMLVKAGVRAVITVPGAITPDGLQKIELTARDFEVWAKQPMDFELAPVPQHYVPYVIFTSGSTGEPKGVEIPEIAVVNHVYDVVERFALDNSSRHLATAALHFDMSVFDIFGPLLHGGSVVMPEPAAGPDPEAWLRLHHRHQVTFWACVPAIMDLLCTVAETANITRIVDSVKNIVMAGDWIPLSLLPRARALFPSATLYSCGGPTETTNWSVIHEIHHDEGSIARSVIYGKPMMNSKYHIVADDLADRPDWVPGEMLVESDISLANGYIGQPELSQQTFIFHPKTGRRMYRTGDLGRYLPNGEIEILGRVDNQIKINGLRVELGEIENVSQKCSGVSRACAVALLGSDGRPKQIALAYIGKANLEPVIHAALIASLPTYMVSKVIQQLDELPLSKNGKVDIRTLREILRNDMKEQKPNNTNSILREIIPVISTILAKPVILPDDNFFDLGGDSLTAMKIKIELEAKLSHPISLENIMLTDTIGEFAQCIS